MKKIKKILLCLVLLLSVTGCLKKDNYDNIEIYTTVYPFEFITEYIYGEHSTIKSIYPAGADLSKYTITPKKLTEFAKTNMFIYNGLTHEKEIAANLINKNKNLDIIDISTGLEIKNNVAELWLSPANFLMIASNIKNNLKNYITNQNLKDQIDAKYDELKLKISELDAELKIIATNAQNNRIIAYDNAFRFLEKYGFEVIIVGDSGENSNTNLTKAKSYISSKTNSYLFMLSTTEENEDTEKLVEAGASIVDIPVMNTLTEDERNNGIDYLSIIEHIIESIKTEVY